jgi:LmbE family N-acetylglucosaminyl deacetylase
MQTPLKLMCVFAHPDDETLGTGGTLARYAAEGVEIHLVTATRGQRGWFGAAEDYPGPHALGQMRETELSRAAQTLGIHDVSLLDYQDGELDQADPNTVIAQIVTHLRRVQPDVVITFDPFGVYGHPDHIAISQFTAAAIPCAADAAYHAAGSPHRVSKLYYLVTTQAQLDLYQATFGDLVMCIDGAERRATGWPEWSYTTRIDTAAYAEQVWRAVLCHKTQLPGYGTLQVLSHSQQQAFWSADQYYRVFSLVNGGRALETDLFEGLRQVEPAQPLT